MQRAETGLLPRAAHLSLLGAQLTQRPQVWVQEVPAPQPPAGDILGHSGHAVVMTTEACLLTMVPAAEASPSSEGGWGTAQGH